MGKGGVWKREEKGRVTCIRDEQENSGSVREGIYCREEKGKRVGKVRRLGTWANGGDKEVI